MTETILVRVPKWNIESETGYKPRTSFWQDFTIADAFGEWKDNCVFITELVMVLNHKIAQWYERNDELAKLYNKYYFAAARYAEDNLKGDKLQYYYRITD